MASGTINTGSALSEKAKARPNKGVTDHTVTPPFVLRVSLRHYESHRVIAYGSRNHDGIRERAKPLACALVLYINTLLSCRCVSSLHNVLNSTLDLYFAT